MEMKNIETLAKKSDFVENNKQTLESKNKLAIGSFKELTNLFLKKKEILLFNNLFSHVHLVKFSKGRIVLNPTEYAPKDLANKVSQLLNDWTGEKWHILMTQEKGDLTLEEQSDMQKAKIIDDFSKDEKIKEILNIFPESKIEEVKKEGENNE